MGQRLSGLLFVIVSNSAKAWATLQNAWRTVTAEHADTYRPEAHYMRGPGPRWRAKHASRLQPPAGLVDASI